MTASLSNNTLFREQAFMSGIWQDAENGATVEVINPATGERIGSVPALTNSQITTTIKAAEQAFQSWRKTTAAERAEKMRSWHKLIIENKEDLARLLTIEQGKPLAESRIEIGGTANFIEWYAEEARRVYGDIIPSPVNNRQTLVTKQPVGVCAAVTPWNFPSSMIGRKVAPAIAAGCSMIIKPSEHTPFSALALAVLAEQAGFPKGLISVVTGDSKEIVKVITDSKTVRKLSFTGSTTVGKLLISQCADTVKRMSMELGGNAPIIVFEDADMDAAVEGVINTKFRNAGQTCICANRIFVQNSIRETFMARLKENVAKMKVGSGLEEGTVIGPMIHKEAAEEMTNIIKKATDQGAKILLGGNPHEKGICYFEPTILEHVTTDMDVAKNEIFGPIAPVIGFDTEHEVIEKANDTDYGLASYLYTSDLGRAWRMSDELDYGMVGINEVAISNEVAPFGGVKQSGFGREGSKYGIDEYLDIKYRCMAGLER